MKYHLSIQGLLSIILMTFFIFSCQSDQSKEKSSHIFEAKVGEIQAEISADSIEANIEKLVSFHTRHTASDTTSDSTGIGAARRWIYDTFQRYKRQSDDRLHIRYDRYTESNHPDLDEPTEIVNVIAVLPGTQLESKDRTYVVGGHYDSRISDIMDSSSYSPGASDNASGTAAVLEMARVMANYEFDATIVFVAFSGKEQGLLGSKYYAEQAFLKNRNIAGMINNDIIGNTADNAHSNTVRIFTAGIPADAKLSRYHRTLLNTGGENDTPSRQLGRFMYQISEKYMENFTAEIIYRKDRYPKEGDHLPLLEEEYPAVRVTQQYEHIKRHDRDVREKNGVQYGDLPDFVNYNYVANVTQLNAAALTTLADAPARPQDVEIVIQESPNNTALQWKANKEPDLKGYEIMWRESSKPHWQYSKFVGDTLQYTVEGVSRDDYIFGVRSVDSFGNASPAVYPLPAL